MKRYSVIKVLTKAMEPGDIGIFIGDGVCRESFAYHREGNLYLPFNEWVFGLGLGIAMNTLRRVFIFCDDVYFLRNMGEVLHIAASKCKNIHIVVLVSGVYSGHAKHPTIYKNINSPIGMLFNMGFVVHDYKRHFKNSHNPTKEIRSIWRKISGPFAAVIEVERGNKALSSDYPTEEKSLADIKSFIQDESTSAYSYTPPLFSLEFSKEA